MKTKIIKEGGFTIVEMLIYMGIFSILITILLNVFIALLNGQKEAESTSSVDQNGRYILARLLYDIPRAQSISIPSAAGSQSNSLQISINSINYLYSVDNNGNFQIKDVTDNLPVDNLSGYDASISGVSFQRIGNSTGKNTIRTSFTVTSRTQREKRPEVQTFQTTIGLR